VTPSAGSTRNVLIVCRNAETVDGLQRYLSGAGLRAEGTEAVDDIARGAASREPRTLVLFPDDFAAEALDEALAAIRGYAESSVVVLVTKAPKRFESRFEDAAVAPVIMAKPAWGWNILDAILGRIDRPKRGAVGE
jgi:hypothetical protein